MSDIDRIANNLSVIAEAVRWTGMVIFIGAIYIGTMIYFRKK